jgi:hypothetical protein
MLPLYELRISDDDHSGVTGVALVDSPAIEVNFQAFHEHKAYKFETVSNEKRILAGPLMIPNTRIYRNDSRGEYDVFFSKETIEQIVDKYHKNQYGQRVNPMHESMMILPDIYMVSSFITNKERGINAPKGFEGLPDGSWFGEFKVRNDEVWNQFIKTGIFKGFSVEGFFEDVPVELSKDEFRKLWHVLEHLNKIDIN